MEDLMKIYELADEYPRQLEQMTEEFLIKLRVTLWGESAIPAAAKEKLKDIPASSPQQTKKRHKRLPSLNEDEESEERVSAADKNSKRTQSPRRSKRSNADLLATADAIHETDTAKETIIHNATTGKHEDIETKPADRISDASSLMPPPPAPVVVPPATTLDETSSGRPQRAAKLNTANKLKEPSTRDKLRRPTNNEMVKVKLEHETRPSQIHQTAHNIADSSKQLSDVEKPHKNSAVSTSSDESVVVVPRKQPSTISVNSDIEDVAQSSATAAIANKEKPTTKGQQKKTLDAPEMARELRIKIKREKISLHGQEEIRESAPKTTENDTAFKPPAAKLPDLMSVSKAETTAIDETTSLTSTILSSTTNTTTATAPSKKGRKKKGEAHKPIKVERFSDLDQKPSPISSRTRHGSIGKTYPTETADNVDSLPAGESKRAASIYEDAVETPPPPPQNTKDDNMKDSTGGIANETANMGVANDATINLGPAPAADATMNLGPVPGDATFCNNPAQTTFQVASGQTTFVMDSTATITNKHSGAVADATFDVQQLSKANKDDDAAGQRSFETAKDSSVPHDDDSLLTEDESCEHQEKPPAGVKSKVSNASVKSDTSSKSSASTKTAYKMPTRTNELFNPLAQSPVKMRVEAFENAAAAATEQSKRPLRTKKENATPSSSTTPVIGKLTGPALGRFLTPTQGSNISIAHSAIAKKGVSSASKALPMPKSSSASSLQRSNSAAKALQRENSADDFRKGIHNLAEERKKQREQKHLLAAQQREAKERERAERMAKLAKEREEKRILKKQQEQEQKKQEMEEIQRKLRQQQEEEAAKMKIIKEREMQMKQQQLAKQRMMPPPPKVTAKYTFEMLHEYDSTDDEDKVSYKRPPPPSWSRSHVRGPNMLKQEYTPDSVIDSFFSVQPMTPDLKIIFPNIDARHLKRNSSVLWSTPPRYSELPKY